MTGVPPMPVASIAGSFAMAGMAGQIIIVILFAVSIVAWSLIIMKAIELRKASAATQAFLAAYRNEPHPAAIFLKRQRYADSPVYALYEKACAELATLLQGAGGDGKSTDDLFMGSVGTDAKRRVDVMQMGAVRTALEKARAEQSMFLESHMGFVAVTTTTAPLLGLLGTAWGAMNAFDRAGGVEGGLAAMAPGMSGALLSTVIGLLVAIPSGIGYSLLSDRVRRTRAEMEGFSQELLGSLERHYQHER